MTHVKSRKTLEFMLPELKVYPFTVNNMQTSEYKDFLKTALISFDSLFFSYGIFFTFKFNFTNIAATLYYLNNNSLKITLSVMKNVLEGLVAML